MISLITPRVKYYRLHVYKIYAASLPNKLSIKLSRVCNFSRVKLRHHLYTRYTEMVIIKQIIGKSTFLQPPFLSTNVRNNFNDRDTAPKRYKLL